jgi:hypothetical protein
MSTGVKIALIGCGLLFVIAIAIFGVGGYFAKKYIGEGIESVKNVAGTEDSEYGKKGAELTKDYPFTPPSNGIITENQLQRFLNVRKSLYEIYRNHEAEFKDLQNQSNQSGFGTAMKGFSLMNELKKTQLEALTEQHMSPDEYRYIVTMVYTTWGSKLANDAKPAANNAVEGLQKSIEELDKQIADPNTPDVLKEQLKKTKEAMEFQIKSYSEIANADASTSVAQTNIDLFNKYQKEITKYQMGGLEYLGF